MVEKPPAQVSGCDCGRHAGRHERQEDCCSCLCHVGGALHFVSCHCLG